MTVFNDCYLFNPSHFGVYTMAKELEQFMLSKLSKIPANVSVFHHLQDFEQVFANCCNFNQCEDDVTLMCKNVENLFRDRLKKFPEKVEISVCYDLFNFCVLSSLLL